MVQDNNNNENNENTTDGAINGGARDTVDVTANVTKSSVTEGSHNAHEAHKKKDGSNRLINVKKEYLRS